MRARTPRSPSRKVVFRKARRDLSHASTWFEVAVNSGKRNLRVFEVKVRIEPCDGYLGIRQGGYHPDGGDSSPQLGPRLDG